jgi:cholest-4-en-3-one 26-monooxygenase
VGIASAQEAGWEHIDNNLTNPEWYGSGEHYEAFRRLRAEDPVHLVKNEAFGKSYWGVFGYEDLRTAMNDPRTYASRHAWSGGPVPRSPERLTAEERFEEMWDSRLSSMDPPTHTYMRGPVNKHFSIPAIARQRERIQQYAQELLDEVRDLGEFDYVDKVASELPMRVTLRMLGVPEDDWPILRLATSRLGQPADPRFIVDGDPQRTFKIGLSSLISYASDPVHDRRENPKDDFATVITGLETQGRPFSDHEMGGLVASMVLGGIETSKSAIGVGMWQLLANPGQLQMLLGSADLCSAYCEEVIRWTTPIRQNLRVAAHDTELHGKDIRAGDWVVLYLASGNRDEQAFERPDEFDITRAENPHLGLGDGPHKCLGRNLVRLEIDVLTRTFLPLIPSMELAEEPRWVDDANFTGLTALHLRTR